MITILGNFFILASIASGFLYTIPLRTRLFFYLQSISTITACVSLLYAFITNDFSVQNVFFYSSTKQPLIYKIGSLWGNHDASLLFFTTLLALVSMIGSRFIKQESAIKMMSIIATSMMLIIYCTSDPFVHIPHAPAEGLGMNPVLQDMAIAIHPPMLYLGYVTYIIPYACFFGMLLSKKREDMEIAYIASKFALGCLTAGISLGSWWAYRELGWGGYWFFDPVENISLIPWLIGIALHHSFIITMRNGKLLLATIALGLTNFLLILLGILIVRSGILVSVHSFASGIVGSQYIIGAFILLIFATILVYFIGGKQKSYENYAFADKAIITGNVVIMAATLCLMIGTFFPIIYQLIKGVSISISNQYFYYVFVPLTFVIVLLAVIAPHLNPRFKFTINTKNTAMVLSHTGILILAIGIALNARLKQDIEFIGKIGTSVKQDNFSVTLKNIKYSEGPNYYRQIGEFWIEQNNEIVILKPENRLYRIENAISAESDIYSFVAKDIYVVLGSLEDDGTLHANIYIRPWMSLIWLGMFLTALGVFVSSVRKRYLPI